MFWCCKMESAIIETDKRLSKQMSVYRNRYAFIEENGTILKNIEENGVKISCGGR